MRSFGPHSEPRANQLQVSQEVATAAAVGAVLATPEAAHARLPEEPAGARGCPFINGFIGFL